MNEEPQSIDWKLSKLVELATEAKQLRLDANLAEKELRDFISIYFMEKYTKEHETIV
jgi:hypothetical protein